MSGRNESGEYNGPENNDFYAEDSGEYESFDDIDEGEFSEDEVQGGSSHDADDMDDDGNFVSEEDEDEEEAPKKVSKKEQKKKDRGQKGDDMDALDLDGDEDEDEDLRNIDDEDEESEDDKEEDSEEEEKKEEEKVEEKPQDKEAKKGKPTYVKIGEETYALDSNALISTPVDGKTEQVTLQELKNNYAGKVAYDKKFNEINLKEQTVKKSTEELGQKMAKFTGVKTQIEEIIKDVEKNPKDALKIFLDAFDVDTYDLEERMFKSDLQELANVLNMDPVERKAHFLEKKNNHLLKQAEKRQAKEKETSRTNLHRSQTDALRKSSGVSEVQYVDSREELLSYGYKDADLTEKDIVEWAATKPHRSEVATLLSPYKDQFQDEKIYGELSWSLVNILRSGKETSEAIKKHLAQVYGTPTEVKELSKKLNPLGRKVKKPIAKPTSKKVAYESFDDIDDDE